MATSTTMRVQAISATRGEAAAVQAPWSIYAVLFASASVIVGVIWDISWHRSIGRDTFWTPAHMGIYLGGVVAGPPPGVVGLRAALAGGGAGGGAAGRRLGGCRPRRARGR